MPINNSIGRLAIWSAPAVISILFDALIGLIVILGGVVVTFASILETVGNVVPTSP